MSQTLKGGAGRQRGFTLVELAVSLFVTVTVLLGVLALFDFSNKLSRAQTNIADMQQSLRVAQADVTRFIRMAGRGGLPLGYSALGVWTGWAVDVSNNVADDTHIAAGDEDTPEVIPGSDVLTVRGVFTSPLYQVNPADATSFTLTRRRGLPTSGTLRIASTTPTGIPQDLSAIRDAIKERRHEALLLVSPKGTNVWAVVELNPGHRLHDRSRQGGFQDLGRHLRGSVLQVLPGRRRRLQQGCDHRLFRGHPRGVPLLRPP